MKYVLMQGHIIRAKKGNVLRVSVEEIPDDPLLLKQGVPNWPRKGV